MKKIKLNVKTKTQNYPIIIGSDLHNIVGKILKKNSINFNKCFLIVDKNVPKKLISNIKNSIKKKEVYIYLFSNMTLFSPSYHLHILSAISSAIT